MGTNRNEAYRPGETVPASGIYECTCGQGHRAFESTDVKGHTFPPPPQSCSGAEWRLVTPAHPESERGE
jgi:hypothetical protein